MAGWVTTKIVKLERSEEVCVGCGECKMELTLCIEADPPDGFEVGDVVAATECCDLACSHSYIRRATTYGGHLDG